MDEVARAGRALEDAGWSGPGVSVQVLWRVYYEKTGFLNWRGRRYDEAVSNYKQACDHAPEGTRDRVRIEAGLLLACLGQEESSAGAFDRAAASNGFGEHLKVARAGCWNDIATIFEENLKRLSDGVSSVQDLLPVEVERRDPS